MAVIERGDAIRIADMLKTSAVEQLKSDGSIVMADFMKVRGDVFTQVYQAKKKLDMVIVLLEALSAEDHQAEIEDKETTND